MTWKRRVYTITLTREGELWQGRIRDNAAEALTGETPETVVRRLEALAFTQLAHEMRHPAAPPVREVRFDVVEE